MLQPNAKVKVNKFTAVHYMLNYVMFILLYSRLQQFVHKYSIVNPINLSTVTLLAVYPATDISLPLPISYYLENCAYICPFASFKTSVESLENLCQHAYWNHISTAIIYFQMRNSPTKSVLQSHPFNDNLSQRTPSNTNQLLLSFWTLYHFLLLVFLIY